MVDWTDLRGAKLRVEPGLHGLCEAGLGVVDHGEAGPLDAAILDGVLDEAQHERLEVVGRVEVAVLCHVLLEVASSAKTYFL